MLKFPKRKQYIFRSSIISQQIQGEQRKIYQVGISRFILYNSELPTSMIFLSSLFLKSNFILLNCKFL